MKSEKNWPLTVGLVILESDSTSVIYTKTSKKCTTECERKGGKQNPQCIRWYASEKLELSRKKTDRCGDVDRMMLVTHLKWISKQGGEWCDVQGCLPASLRYLQKQRFCSTSKERKSFVGRRRREGQVACAQLEEASLRVIVTWSLYSGFSVKVQITEQCRCDLQPHMEIGFDIFWKY